MNKFPNPIRRFQDTLARAESARIPLPNAFSLATVGGKGQPSVRMMLLKEIDKKGFVFYTNLESRKAREIEKNPRAALCFWWPALKEQVRVEGALLPVGRAEADAYFSTRPRGSQIGAWASLQSETLSSRKELIQAVERVKKRYHGKPVPRPPFWSGFTVVPDRMEFWFDRTDRLHERILYARRGGGWDLALLYP